MKELFEDFSTLLRERLIKTQTTEDSVRYTFFAALLRKTNIAPHEVILEYPHPKIPRAKVDTYIPSTPERKGLILEFKYDRQIPSKKNLPRPKKAGNLFKDIRRLIQFDVDSNSTRWLIYLTDNEMTSYFRNKRNGLIEFFELPVGDTLRVDKEFISSKSDTFRDAIGGSINADIKCILNQGMPKQHEVRIYEILPLSIT